jgi:hypothetical protein
MVDLYYLILMSQYNLNFTAKRWALISRLIFSVGHILYTKEHGIHMSFLKNRVNRYITIYWMKNSWQLHHAWNFIHNIVLCKWIWSENFLSPFSPWPCMTMLYLTTKLFIAKKLKHKGRWYNFIYLFIFLSIIMLASPAGEKISWAPRH